MRKRQDHGIRGYDDGAIGGEIQNLLHHSKYLYCYYSLTHWIHYYPFHDFPFPRETPYHPSPTFTALHQLLLGLCISDLVLSSIAMSFASILSPTDHIGWMAMGNMTLCRTQGFLQFFGHIAAPLYNCSLCVYYLIEIKYTDLINDIERIEIGLHAVPILTALALSVTILLLNGIHPEVTNCFASATYPFECRFNPDVECEGTMMDNFAFTLLYKLLIFIFVPLTIFGSMTMIYRRVVASQEDRMNQYRFSFTRRSSTSAHRNTIVARNRATAYSVVALLLS